ncbi:MAG: efflux RND transporter permease subunit, partial [Paraperlucidibaca sp.]
MSRFFIDRPIFAWVIAILIMLAGLLSIENLPVSQYPSIAPPSISISGSYPGASAKTVEDSVTQVIEQKMQGIDGLSYLSSSSDSNGSVSITLSFISGTDPDIAQVQVQNKLQLALPLLPDEVQRSGLRVAKATRNFLLVVGFVSEDGSMSQYDLGDYVSANLVDPLSRVKGVGDTQLFGAQYAMRIWLDPAKLVSYKLVPADIIAAIQAQNTQVSAGQLGATPSVPGQQLNATITAQSRLKSAEEFNSILLKTQANGATVYLRDVARVELGSESYNTIARFKAKPATGMAIKMATGANALETARLVKERVAELAPYFPHGMKAVFPYDTTPFVKLSIEEVVKTLIEAIILVFLVMLLFLQNLRATLIPTLAVPVVLLGTFGVLAAFGYSINTLTMFAMVLAIGLLVDDAIVVVENVERVMREDGLGPVEATRKSMSQITGALVGIALVLSAVFIPMAFFGGSAGVIYRQFSITIVSAMVLSVVVALVLTPALCATLLKPIHGHEHEAKTGFFGWFNRSFDRGSKGYQGIVATLLQKPKRWLVLYALIIIGLVVMFVKLPTSFLPEEDQGFMYTLIQLPAGATQERTLAVLKQVEHHFLETEKDNIESMFGVVGFSFAGSGQNAGLTFVRFKDWSKRKRDDQSVNAVAARARAAFSKIRDGVVFPIVPPAVRELGNAGGFDLQLQDRGGLGHAALIAARNQLLAMAAQSPVIAGARPNGQEDTPEYQLDIDAQKAAALGISLSDINSVLSTAWGGRYVNDFLDRGRVKRVYVQGDAPARMLPSDVDRWFARTKSGDMVPFSAFATARWGYASPRLERYNGQPSVNIQGSPAPGFSSGEAMNAIEEIITKLPPGIGFEWTGVSEQERSTSGQAPVLYAISLLVVFLCLAALYESWSIPFAVMLVVPLGIVGAVVAT